MKKMGEGQVGRNQESHLVILNLRCWCDTQMEVSRNSWRCETGTQKKDLD